MAAEEEPWLGALQERVAGRYTVPERLAKIVGALAEGRLEATAVERVVAAACEAEQPILNETGTPYRGRELVKFDGLALMSGGTLIAAGVLIDTPHDRVGVVRHLTDASHFVLDVTDPDHKHDLRVNFTLSGLLRLRLNFEDTEALVRALVAAGVPGSSANGYPIDEALRSVDKAWLEYQERLVDEADDKWRGGD